MKRQNAVLAVLLLGSVCSIGLRAAAQQQKPEPIRVKTYAVLPRLGRNAFYTGNRPPLVPQPLIPLPVGAVRPEGWLKEQLVLMSNGFTGHLTEISPWCQFDGSAWVSPTGEGKNGWEELPYWLRGYTSLGYLLRDRHIIREARRWIDGILNSQRPDGYFGPEANREAKDLWPNMLALYALRTYYEATGDKRVIPFMERYFRWEAGLPLNQFLPDSWQKVRGGDNLDSILWLYNRTGEKWLLDLAKRTHEHTADWADGVASWHGVNLCEGFREPAEFYEVTGDPRYYQDTVRDYHTAWGLFGQVPGGMIGADENARPGYTGPRQAAETCAMVEVMYSDEMLTSISGDPHWADRCEDVAFNSLPASMTPDLKGLHYLTAPNMIQLDRASKAPLLQDGGDMLSYNPYDYRCCQHNVAFGWPYFTEHLWMATGGNGLAAVLYAPSTVTARVGHGETVTLHEETRYPFDEHIYLRLSMKRASAFPLVLRVPAWCTHPVLKVNGERRDAPTIGNGGWIVLQRLWRSHDTVELTFPMSVRVKVWRANHNAISLYRGPLAYSLRIGERWVRYGGTAKWPAYEVFPTTSWNYGLVLDLRHPSTSVSVEERKDPFPVQPFSPTSAPVVLKVRAKQIPQWTAEPDGLIGELQQSPVRSASPTETVALIPMGCARLRVSAFPLVGEGPDAHDWIPENRATASASWCNPSDSVEALKNLQIPTSSADQSLPRFTWWDHRGTSEWVEYDFAKSERVSWCRVYWFDDETIGGGCRVPAAWRILWWNGSQWQPVETNGDYGVQKNCFNRVDFVPVETTKLRLEVQLKSGYSGGILAWQWGSS
ncbi:MAG TPA: beta-L-arabinofuranosidase domain-containing protein [Chthonomonas sp.]|uniref:beta-L-arabinofuranosidase domain-containing protein n=1 Tax=Chthonomonas sp. TaxID=2282153 RepID=UPI002B4B098C|nr:beta-L-arabinofuranosidase domain-containing protein [Chthonomonas sp.]HLH81468.1 beta-L-arabinofuranosidase domain-containing protein [Chthonomonas sp.]